MDISSARPAIESLYFDRATIIEYRNVIDPDTYQTRVEEVVICEDLPCKLSHVFTNYVKDGVVDSKTLVSKIFISPDIEVKAGCKIIVTGRGVTNTYKNSGESARFTNHQEIKLLLEDDKS